MRATIEPPRTAPSIRTSATIPVAAEEADGTPAIRPVVLPLDGSALSERARPWAVAIARLRRAPLVLMGVVDPYQASSLGLAAAAGVPLYDTLVPNAVQDVTKYLEAQAEQCAADAPGLQIDVRVQIGDAAREILHGAGESDAQLVVLTTHGRGGVDRWIRGSVAERIVSHGHLPVMLIRPWDHRVPEVTADHLGWRVLVPLDGTPLAEASLAEAARLAVGGEVLLVRDVAPMHGEWSFDPSEQLEANAEAEAYLERVAERMRVDGTLVRTVVLTRPEVVDAITELVSMEAVDVVVVATHGRGAIGRWLHGSVSDDLALHAPVPVLLVHTAERVVAN
jgi:nucleotide-binding universal stress UspA family protein